MKRTAFNVASALSLLAFVAAVALWVRSYFVQDTLTLFRARSTANRFYKSDHRAFSVRGQLFWKVSVRSLPPEFAELDRRERERDGTKDFAYVRARADEFFFNPSGPSDPWWVRWGFRYSYSLYNRATPFMMAQTLREAAVPHWFLAAVAGALPAAWAVGWWRRRRVRNLRGFVPSEATAPGAGPKAAQEKGPGDRPGPSVSS